MDPDNSVRTMMRARLCGRLTARSFVIAAAVCGLTLIASCGRGYDEDIRKGSAVIAVARTDAERAVGYARRGGGYSEEARYLRAFKRIPRPEYDRLFSLAIKDLDQAIALAPA